MTLSSFRQFGGLMTHDAVFSDDRMYRYSLIRAGLAQTKGRVNFIGLNPSTADERTDDPTIRRCMGFAKLWLCASMVMTNLYAYRSTDPFKLRAAADPVGPLNDEYLLREARAADLVIVAWSGIGSKFVTGRTEAVKMALESAGVRLYCLGLTRHGAPKHPLYLRADTKPVRFASA